MKIHITIEFDGATQPRISVQTPRPTSAPEVPRAPQPVAEENSATPGTPAEAASEAHRDYDATRKFTRIVPALLRMPTPFTRAALAVELNCSKESATAQLNRLQKRGWVESPAHGLWRLTPQFNQDNK